MTTDELTCKQLVELVTAYLEEALPARDEALFNEHLATCSGCRIYVDQMRQTIRQLGSLPRESIDPEAEQKLLEAFRDWKYNQQKSEPSE
jgi:anti-sigma factor RsiW